MSVPVEPSQGLSRWWVYQRERFPIFGHGPLILAFSFSAVSFSSLLRSRYELPAWPTMTVAFVTCFLFFFQLRIADEFKDFEEDSRYRPYRAVPRGLVSLRELGILGGVFALIQFALALWLSPPLLWFLLLAWGYFLLMSKEFFVRDWLKARPVLYLLSHMLIMPIVDLYATACDWWPNNQGAPAGLIWFLVVSYFNGIVIELGRKIRAPQDEEEGVETYSVLWGPRVAVGVWYGAMLATAGFAATAAWQIEMLGPIVVVLVFLVAVGGLLALRYALKQERGRAKWVERFSGIWTLCMYLSLGAVPLVWKWWVSG